MACLLSLSFYVPPSAPPRTFFKETYPSKSVIGGLSNQPIYRTATELSMSCTIHRAISSLNQSYWPLSTPSRRHCEIVCCHMNVDRCTLTIIAGYWVGPDIDDGWGYIEAFINPIT